MEVRYYVNPMTGRPHVLDHSVTEDEVEFVLATSDDDRRGTGSSRICTGPTHGGRLIRIIYVPDDDGEGLFVVTAYPLSGKQKSAARRRRRRRSR